MMLERPEVRSLVMIFFVVTTFLLGSIAVDAEIARTTDASYGAVIWVAMVLSCGAFLVAAVIFARRDLRTNRATGGA